jgi:hypothetical protein
MMLRKIFGWIALLLATWCMISAQAPIGLKELKWMTKYAFPAEVLLGCVLFSVAYWVFNLKQPKSMNERSGRKI